MIRPRNDEEKRKLLRELMEERFGPLPPQRKPPDNEQEKREDDGD